MYSYRRFSGFLDVFDLREIILEAPAELLVALRKQPGFIRFIDAYAGIAGIAGTETSLKFYAGRAKERVSYAWNTIPGRRLSLFDASPIEVSELASALGEVGEVLASEHGLPVRGQSAEISKERRVAMPKMDIEPELVLFVALDEELRVLADALGLAKNVGTPEATGRIGEVPVDVVCPRNMGRVAAAVAMSSYLAKRKTPPKLILIVGIAGGFKENGSKEGHIIVVTKVVDLALRKVVDEEEGASPNFRREDYRMNEALARVIGSDHFDKEEWSIGALKFGWPEDRRPSIHYGPMASSDEVVSSDRWRNLMIEGKGGETKLLGVEMEAGGVCASAERLRVPFCMVRAISDQADPSKADNQWRSLGMRTLASLLERVPLSQVLSFLG